MGPHLRGGSAPFTRTGRTALAKSSDYRSTTQLGQAGHSGILAILRCDRDKIVSLLPPPLEPVPHSEIVGLYVNQTQSGLNRHRPEGEEGLGFLNELSPHHINWHEAFFKIPCSFQGQKAVLFPLQYKEVDHAIALGCYNGLVTKLASFSETFPMPGQPENDEMAPGRTARMTISRHDERIMTVSFQAESEVPAARRQQIIDVVEWWNVCGVVYFPDFARPGGPPLVNRLVMSAMGSGEIVRAWSGRAEVDFGLSDWDELQLLQPVEVLESFFAHYQYQSGVSVRRVLHDYLTDPII